MKGKVPDWKSEIKQLCSDFGILEDALNEIIDKTMRSGFAHIESKAYNFAHRLFIDAYLCGKIREDYTYEDETDVMTD